MAEVEVPEIIATILSARGHAPEVMAAFLYPDYEAHQHDPWLLTDMKPAVERIVQAAERGERVVIYGDYDIDGITASAVMIEGLAHLGIAATSYIPDRFEEGYGLNLEALAQLKTGGADLIITVDCGITSVTEAAWARDNGLDLIITDHHAVPAVLPDAIAVVNPKRPDDPYPFKELAGVGVAFKLIQALQSHTGQPAAGQEKWLLDLVALGTVCDVMDLVGENRVFVTYGLKVLRQTRRVGLRALAAVGGIDIAQIESEQLGFVLGPRMNAAGRLEHAARSLELVMTHDPARAQQIAMELEKLNQQRRSHQAAVFAAADVMAAQYTDDPVLVLAGADWSHGIVGIVASKLVEKWHKPVLVMQVLGETVKGSARSTPNFNMVDGLRSAAPLLQRFGGHYYAAGYTLAAANLDAFRAAMNQAYRELASERNEAAIAAEIELSSLTAADWRLWEQLELLQPFGAANPQPLLGLTAVQIDRADTMGADKRHYRLQLSDGSGTAAEAVGFGWVDRLPDLKAGQTVTICLRLNKNEWQGRRRLQLNLADIRYA